MTEGNNSIPNKTKKFFFLKIKMNSIYDIKKAAATTTTKAG